MALIAAGMSPYASTPRPAVSYYAPQPSYPAPSSRYTPPSRPPPQVSSNTDWARLEAFAQSKAGQEQIWKSTPQPEPEQEGFWGSGFGKGLGFVINNPITHVITKPLNYLQMFGRAATLGVEEAAEALEGAPGWAQFAAKSVPVAGQLIAGVDTERTEADKRSNWSKVLSPETTYGYGELLDPENPQWVNRVAGLGGDIVLDPLTYLTGAASRVVAGGSHIDEAARLIDEAAEGFRVANEAGDAAEIARAADRLAEAEDYVARAPTMGNLPDKTVPLPRNRIERGELVAELTSTPEGRAIMEQFPEQIKRGATRGFQTMSPEAKAAMGIQRPGLRLRGLGWRVPGTGAIAQGLNVGGGAIRQGMANLPGEDKLIRNIRTPKGLERAYNILTRDVDGDMLRAGTAVWLRDEIRTGTGAQVARGNRALTQGIKQFLHGKDEDTIRRMVLEAETLDAPNEINEIASRLLAVYQSVTGREIDPHFLRNPDKYFPHLLDPKFRRFLARAAKRGDASALDFKKVTGIVDEELLEDPAFYVDNMMGGSGFLSKARKFGTHLDGTAATPENPQVLKIGGTEVTFTADDVGHINEQLKKAFPSYEGDFYDVDPVRVFEAYNRSLSRQAGRDIAAQKLVASGNPLGATMTGDIDEMRKAIDAALSMQKGGAILSTAQGKYEPGVIPPIPETPAVPGSAAEWAPVEKLRTAAEETADDAERAALNAQADQLEADILASRPGGIDPDDYFTHMKGEKATEARDYAAKRAKTWATAAAAETRSSMEKLRDKIAEVKEIIISPLKTNIKEMDGEVTLLNRKVRAWKKTIDEFGDLTPDSLDDMTVLMHKIDETATNAELKLANTRRAYRGSATKAQRSIEARLRTELENLKAVQAAAEAKIQDAPQAMRDELAQRLQWLDADVKEAQGALLRKEMSVARPPHGQAEYDRAVEEVTQGLEAGTDPEELLATYRKVATDIQHDARIDAQNVAELTPEQAAAEQKYLDYVHQLHALGAKYGKGGKMPREARTLYNRAVAAREEFDRLVARTSSPEEYDRLASRVKEIDKATARIEKNLGSKAEPVMTKESPGVYNATAGDRSVKVNKIEKVPEQPGGPVSPPGRNGWEGRNTYDVDGKEIATYRKVVHSDRGGIRGSHQPRATTLWESRVDGELVPATFRSEREAYEGAVMHATGNETRHYTITAAEMKQTKSAPKMKPAIPGQKAGWMVEGADTPYRTLGLAEEAAYKMLDDEAERVATEARRTIDSLNKERGDLTRRLGEIGGESRAVSEYDKTLARLSELDTLIEEAPRAQVRKLVSERNRLNRYFQPGGKFYSQAEARTKLGDMAAYNARVFAATADERANLERKLAERARRQESIIWASPRQSIPLERQVMREGTTIKGKPIKIPTTERNPGMRYMTAYGEDPSHLEGMGWGLGETRYPEPVIETEEGVQGMFGTPAIGPPGTGIGGVYDPAAYRMPGGELAGVPTPRTEQEALQSLESRIETGGPERAAAQIEARRAGERVVRDESTLEARIAEEQAAQAEVSQMDMERALGPLEERAQTYRNLATDVTDRRNLVAKREETKRLRDRIRANPKGKYTDLNKVLNDLDAVAKANPYLDDAKLNQVESLLNTHRDELLRITDTKMRVSTLDRVVADAESGKLGDVMIATLNNNWRALHNGPVNTGDIIMDAELYKSFVNLFEVSRQPKAMGRLFNAFTNMFKTYATLTPGFQVRNAIGGVFMNTADGVGLKAQLEGVQLWHKYMDEGEEWLLQQPKRIQDAFTATFASGAGGRFEETGMLARSQNRAYDWLSSNRVTRFAQRRGTNVEGSLRLGMALASVDEGRGIQGALQRITRVHFDYSQVSELDETMKRIIPFWTFMSRNLPLQIQEMWTNPRVYSYYDHLVTNFKLPDEEFTPEYWTRQGAWRTPLEIAGAPIYAQPDLGFTRMQQDVEMASKLLSGEDPGLAMSQANPLIGATLDFLNKRDSFYGRNYGPEDYKKMSGPLGAAIGLIAKPLGQTNEMGQVSENFTNYIQSLLPTVNQAIRLAPQTVGEDSSPQTWVKRARWLGIPMQALTPSVQDSEYWRQYYAMLDEQDRQKAMLQEAAS